MIKVGEAEFKVRLTGDVDEESDPGKAPLTVNALGRRCIGHDQCRRGADR